MNTAFENRNQPYLANGLDGSKLQADADARDLDARLDPEGLPHVEDLKDGLEAFKSSPATGPRPSIDPIVESNPKYGIRDPWRKRITARVALVALMLAVAGVIAPFAWSYLQSYESTDDAQIDGHIDPISSRISGTVIHVYAEDDDRVTKGQLLVEIDPRDYQVTVEQARARFELALAQVDAARQDYAAALANVRQSEAANFKAQRDAHRYSVLLDTHVVAQEDYDQYTSIARVDAAMVDSNREAAGSALTSIAAREAAADGAKAALDQALLNLSYTKIYAPANGIVGKRGVQLNSRIQPGQTLMFVTETDAIWVIANFKETQLARMHRGQKAIVYVDTFERNYRGYIRNMPGASGDRFSLLPAENATGNYVKVVQRLPVRICLEPGQDPEHLLHPGMSVEPTVWLR
jgi:membrane fusion protein, multidrug efflux system